MPDLSAEILLRPTRIGFLTSPTDLASVRTIMRANACLWGGIYNPIIPVFKRAPIEWRPELHRRVKSSQIAKGYVRFFEPDVFVESEKGLLEQAGLGAIRQEHALHPQVITLKELLEPEDHRDWAEPKFGLSIHDVLVHIYKTEQRFVRRETAGSVYASPDRRSAITEAVFGAYPASKYVNYIKRAYADVYRPEEGKPTPELWRRVYLRGAGTALRVTSHGIDTTRYWHHDLLVFVFDPTRATDLIDLWNLRIEPHPVLPVPVDWFEALTEDLGRILRAEHRPIEGNPSGLMHNGTIEFGRSIPRAKAEVLVEGLKDQVSGRGMAVKYWRNSIWIDHPNDDRVHRERRLKLVVAERRADLVPKAERSLHTTFETIDPGFAKRHGGRHHRWTNVLRIRNYTDFNVAMVLPFNLFNRTWPRLGMGGDASIVTSEGWVFPQEYANLGQYVSLLTSEEAIAGSLTQFGIAATLSEPGHIAKQMLEHLGGLWGAHLLADIGTLTLLNKMAGGLRRKRNLEDTVEETFGLRTAPLRDWTDLIATRRTQRKLARNANLEDFTQRNVIRLGLETDCPHCNAKNWTTLTVVDYRVTCERCLKAYDFPQATLRDQNRNFTYRVIGPFSVPDYGRGSYSALLTLRFLERFNSSSGDMTYSTAMNLSFDGAHREIDLVALHAEDRLASDYRRPPRLIIGEAKSLGSGELITGAELAKLRSVAAKLPGAVVAISVLRDHFTKAEKKLLRKFARWGRRPNAHQEPTNPVLLLTAHELTMEFLISSTWKGLGGAHGRFADFEHTRSLLKLADATQQIYLDLPPFHNDRDQYWQKRLARRKAARRVVSQINPAADSQEKR